MSIWQIWVLYCFKIIMLTWNEIKKDMSSWKKLQMLLLGEFVINMNVLLRMLFLFQIIPVLTIDVLFKQRQKDISKFVQRDEKLWVKYKMLQDAKERVGLGLPDLKFYFAACCLAWIKYWMTLRNIK